MNTKKEIFNYFSEKKIYLNYYFLDLATERLQKTKNVFAELDAIEAEYSIITSQLGTIAKVKAAFVIDSSIIKHREKVSKPVIMINKKTGEEIREFSSMYQAALFLEKKNGFGPISAAANGKIKSAYGFKWQFAKKD